MMARYKLSSVLTRSNRPRSEVAMARPPGATAIICRRLRKTIEFDPFMWKNVSVEHQPRRAGEVGTLVYVSGAAAGGVRTRELTSAASVWSGKKCLFWWAAMHCPQKGRTLAKWSRARLKAWTKSEGTVTKWDRSHASWSNNRWKTRHHMTAPNTPKGVFIATQLNSTQLNLTQLNSTDPAEQRTAKSVVFLFMTLWPTSTGDQICGTFADFGWQKKFRTRTDCVQTFSFASVAVYAAFKFHHHHHHINTIIIIYSLQKFRKQTVWIKITLSRNKALTQLSSVTRNYCCRACEVTLSLMDTLIALTYLHW